VQSDVGGTISCKHVLSEESALRISDRRLIAGFVEHHFALDEQCLCHPLDIFREVSIEFISLLNQCHGEDQHGVVSVDHGPCDRAYHQRNSFTCGLKQNFVVFNFDDPLLLHESYE